MSETTSGTTTMISARCEQRLYPRYDALHGTPHAMLWRKVTIETPRGNAAFEQTDYGHPRRDAAGLPRGVSPGMTGRRSQLQAAAEALAALQE